MISRYTYRNPAAMVAILMALPLLWFGLIYIGSFFTLLINSFYSIDEFTGQIVREFSLSSYSQLLHPANLDIAFRTLVMASVVTVISILLAFPLAYYIAFFSTPLSKPFWYVAVMLPLWSSYLVRVYSWKLILSKEGILSWFLDKLSLTPLLEWILSNETLGGTSLSTSWIGTTFVFTYIWLPFMILPIQVALERLPRNYIAASKDLGASGFQTFRHVVLPLAIPGVAAGSIFTFSLTLGDYIIPGIIGPSRLFIGQVVYIQQGTAGNIPLAAAFSVIPIVISGIFLVIMKRLGAFNAL